MAENKVFTFDVDHQHPLTKEEGIRSQLSPLLQNAVRNSVLTKRQARGEGPIKLEDNEPKNYELTKEEVEKKEKRKKQNREAAKRCRLKKKSGQTGTNKKLDDLKKDNGKLQKVVEGLKQKVQWLQAALANHESSNLCVYSAQGHCYSEYTEAITHPNSGHDHDVPQYEQMDGSLSYIRQHGIQDEVKVPDPCYSPVSSCSSPYPDQQATLECQLQLPEEKNENVFDLLTSPTSYTGPGFQPGLPEPTGWSADITATVISGNDMWLGDCRDSNRDIPGMIQDDGASLYPISVPNDDIKPGPEVTTNGNIGIPSLDNIQLQDLVTTSLLFTQFPPRQ